MLLLSAILSFSLTLAVVQMQPVMENSYIAAVYEHNLIDRPGYHITLSRPAALQHMKKNLDIYEEQAAKAAEQGVQILVFPEYGIHGCFFSRSSIYNYLESIPDPQQERWNPCTEPGKHNNTEVLQRLSCMARRNNLYLVANMPDLQPCPLSTDPSSTCPSDGHWQFNTNVVFRSDGLLVARYHKYNLYYEGSYDTPPQPEIITFDTPFAGRFGLIICYDILFHKPTIALVEKGVRQLIFPTAWSNMPPLLNAVQFHRAFSLNTNVTFLSANLRFDVTESGGSGIYTPFFSIYHRAQRGDPQEGKLLVARVPVLDPEWSGQKETTEERTTESTSSPDADFESSQTGNCSDASVPQSSNIFTSTINDDPFTSVLLNEMEGEVNVCHGSFCCHLQYKRLPHDGSNELYALGAFSGWHNVTRHYALQVCAVIRCAWSDPSSCGLRMERAESKMDFLLEGKFGTKYVYPSVLASRFVVEDPKHFEMAADGRVSMKHSNMTGGLVTASLYGRIYPLDKD